MNKDEHTDQSIREEKACEDDEQQKCEEESIESKTYSDNLTCTTDETAEETTITDRQDKSDDVSTTENHPSNQPVLSVSEKRTEHKDEKGYDRCVSETYDVITGTEVQDLKGWESIHKENLFEIPPIDHGALNDLESRAKDVASNLDHLLGTLAASLKSMSVISVQSVDTYNTSIQNVEDTVDVSIKNMYTLIAKCEELNSHMGPVYTMAAQIKDIKRTLDVFESVCK